MSRTIEAEYLAEERVLKLARPLDGIADHARVHVVIEQHSSVQPDEWPTVGEKAGRELARAVRDAFGRDDISV